jgi:hypothetical protein
MKRLRKDFRHLLEPDNMLNLCFFFESPICHQEYNKAKTIEDLDNLGAFSFTRWKHLAEIHVLFPSDVGHFYIARRADLPHYQEVFSKFVTALESYDDRLPVYLYMKDNDYKNHFLSVRNSPEKVKPFIDQINWTEVHRLASLSKKKAAKTTVEKKRQATYEDTGFCSSVNTTRTGTSDGIAEPRMKPETIQNNEVVNGYVVLSKFLLKTGAKWCNGKLYIDPELPDRHRRFAARIHEENVFECMRLSVTDLKSKCACHCDDHNSFNPAFTAVAGLSVVRTIGGKEVRISINAQARKSVDECLARSKMYAPLMSSVLSAYEEVPEARKVISKALVEGGDCAGMVGFRCLMNRCNMDPMSYIQPFLHYSILLVQRFGLTFPETVSLMAAIEVLPNTAYYFAAAAESLLCLGPSELHTRHRGFAFGFLLASLSLHYRRIRSNNQPKNRFSIYWDPELPDGKEWEARCTLKTFACLRFHSAFGSLVDKKKRAVQYRKLRIFFCSTTPNVDVLVTNHVLGICSCLGLLPSWVRGEVEVSPSSRYMQWFFEKFELPSSSDTVEQITENLRHALSTRYGIFVSRRKVENVLCKHYRMRTDSRSDARFCDLAFKGQMLFECEGEGLRITYPSTTNFEDCFVEDYLVTKWTFGNTLLSVEDINGKLGMSDKGVPTSKEASDWTVPDGLMVGRAHTKVEFDICHKIEVKCTNFFRMHLQKVANKLR